MKRNSHFLHNTTGTVRCCTFGLMTLGVTVLSAIGLSTPSAQAQTYTEHTLYSFKNDSVDGQNPAGDLLNVSGIFYGTTSNGGSNFNGTVFSFDPSSNAESVVYYFGSVANDGDYPLDGLISLNGTLYGTSNQAGNMSNSSGTVFSLDPTHRTETTVYNFQGGISANDGENPRADLIAVNGLLYGTTSGGGTSSDGTIFAVDPSSGHETILHTFKGTTSNNDGSDPASNLINVNGVLYGTTQSGGANSNGTIFSINPDGSSYQTLYSFKNGALDGQSPQAGLVDLTVNGTESLYGTTAGGGTNDAGSLYSINLSTHEEKVLFNFGGSNNGSDPLASLIAVNGILYGTTYSGGGSNNDGIVFAFDPSSLVETVLHSFQGVGANDGSGPEAALINVNGTLYGTTNNGGVNGLGTIFSLVPNVAAPTAGNDSYTTNYKTTLNVSAPGVLSNDTNGGGTVVASLVNNARHGSLTFHADGSFTYTPTGAYVGTDSFTYQDTNSAGNSNTATVTITIQPVAPIAVNNSNNVKADTPFSVGAPGVLGNDDNGGSSPITATLVSNVSHGTLTLSSNGAFTYTPNHGFIGTDSFTYQAVNSVGSSNVATASLIVQASVPTAINNSNNVKADTPFTVGVPGVLGNDYDGGSPMTAVLVTNVSHGTLTLSSNGAFTYTPSHGFIGTDSFTYQAVNSVGKSNIATATLIVQASVPTAVNNSNNVKADTPFTVGAPGVLGNDYDGGSPMTASLVTTTSHGTLTLSSSGAFTYTPAHGFIGTDSFTYQAVNATGKSNIATATLIVQASVPTAVNNSNNVKENTPFTVPAPGVLGNDYDGGSPMTAALVTTTSHGTLTLNSNGGFTYTPNTNFTGTDSFTYQAVNSVGKSNIATATLIVQ